MAILYSIWWTVAAAMSSPASGGLGGLGSLWKLPLSFVSAIPSWMSSSYVVWIALFLSVIGPGTIADVLQQKAPNSVRSLTWRRTFC